MLTQNFERSPEWLFSLVLLIFVRYRSRSVLNLFSVTNFLIDLKLVQMPAGMDIKFRKLLSFLLISMMLIQSAHVVADMSHLHQPDSVLANMSHYSSSSETAYADNETGEESRSLSSAHNDDHCCQCQVTAYLFYNLDQLSKNDPCYTRESLPQLISAFLAYPFRPPIA